MLIVSQSISGVPILHLIVTPFPSVWHKAGDNANAIDWDDTEDLDKILRVFVAEYLQGSVQQSPLSSQFAFRCCNLPQLLNTQKNVPFHLNLHLNPQF